MIGLPLGQKSPLLLGPFGAQLPDYSMFYQDDQSRFKAIQDAMAMNQAAGAAKVKSLVPDDFKFKGYPIDYAGEQQEVTNLTNEMAGLLSPGVNYRSSMSSPEWKEKQARILQLTDPAINEQRDLMFKSGEKRKENLEAMAKAGTPAGSDLLMEGDLYSVGFTDQFGNQKKYSIRAVNDPTTGMPITNDQWISERPINEGLSIRGRGADIMGRSDVVSFKANIMLQWISGARISRIPFSWLFVDADDPFVFVSY